MGNQSSKGKESQKATSSNKSTTSSTTKQKQNAINNTTSSSGTVISPVSSGTTSTSQTQLSPKGHHERTPSNTSFWRRESTNPFKKGLSLTMTYSPTLVTQSEKYQRHSHQSAMKKPARVPLKPTLEKNLEEGGNTKLIYSSCSMQGWRLTMEDAHFCHLTIPTSNQEALNRNVSMFGIFDGHGGSHVSNYVSKTLSENIASQPTFLKGDYLNAIKQGFYKTDNDANANPSIDCDSMGCTAIVTLITQSNVIFVGNSGDCRAVLSTGGNALPLSLDHKAEIPSEQERIIKAGGYILNGRIMGDLAVSRSLGDFRFKNCPTLPLNMQMVSSEPDIAARRIVEEDEFLILACDGIFDTIGDQELVDFIRIRISQGLSLSDISKEVLDRCIVDDVNEYSTGTDNMSIIIIGLIMDKGIDYWRDKVGRFLKQNPVMSKVTPKGMSPEWTDEEKEEYLRLKDALDM